MPSEKSRVLARYGAKVYQDVFKVKRKPTKKQIMRAKRLWGAKLMGFGKAPKIDLKMRSSKNKRAMVAKTKKVATHERKWGRTSLSPKTYKNRWKVKGHL